MLKILKEENNMKDSRFRFARDGEIYYNGKDTGYRIDPTVWKGGGKTYTVKKGKRIIFPKEFNYIAEAKMAARAAILEDEQKAKVWVVMSDWTLEARDTHGSTVHGVFKDLQEAKKVWLDEVMRADSNMEFTETDSEEKGLSYSIWELGNYADNHINVKVVESKITE